MIRASLRAVAPMTFVAITALGFATAAPAYAQSTPSAVDIRIARDLFAKAEKDEAAQQWGPALEKLQRAGTIKMTAGIRFHIALCEENLGRLLDAQTDYTAALELARTDQNKDAADAATEALNQLRARIPTLKVMVPAGVADVEVIVDKKPISAGEAGYVTQVEPGTHTLEVRAPGRQPYAKSIKVVEREITTVEPPLLPIAATPAPPPTTTARTSLPTEPSTSEPSQSRGGSKALPIAVTAGAVALVGLGFGAYVIAGSKADDGKKACEAGGACDSEQSSIRMWDTLALTGWISGAVLGGVAIYLWAKPSRSSTTANASPHALTPVAATPDRHLRLVPWGQGMRLEGSF